jgi:hypothetical protein
MEQNKMKHFSVFLEAEVDWKIEGHFYESLPVALGIFQAGAGDTGSFLKNSLSTSSQPHRCFCQ